MSVSLTRRILIAFIITVVALLVLLLMNWSALSQIQSHIPKPYLVADINTAPNSSSPANLTPMDGILYFAASDNNQDTELWRSDGTISGTFQVENLNPSRSSAPTHLTSADNSLLFFLSVITGYYPYSRQLCVSDGSEGGTTCFNSPLSPSELTAVANLLYFSADDGVNGSELWRSDGTESGTYLIKNIHSAESSNPINLTNVNGILYFSATDDSHGTELWRSDGAPDGTVMVKDIHPDTGSEPSNLAHMAGILYFSAVDSSHGRELWRSDGTDSGTFMVKDIVDGIGSGSPTELTAVNNQLFFVAEGALWQTDGTEVGTQKLESASGVPTSPTQLTACNNLLYFQADDGTHGMELWRSNGTVAGTVMVKDIYPAGSSNPEHLTAINNQLFFQANGGDGSGVELWVSDGTAVGTVQVSDIYAGASSANPDQLVNMNGTLYFAAADDRGIELWRSNGNEADTTLVRDIANGTGDANPTYSTAGSSTLYTFASDSEQRGLWATDGSADDPRFLAETYPHQPYMPAYPTPDANFGRPIVVEDKLFYANDDGISGEELWVSDGSPTGTMMVRDIMSGTNPSRLGNLTAINSNQLIFRAQDETHGDELWISDGTLTNTHILTDIIPGSASSFPYSFTHIDDLVYFRANDATLGDSIWRSDGTVTGTERIVDIIPDDIPSYYEDPGLLTSVSNLVFFAASHPAYGREFWRSDGTQNGTWMLRDIAPGSVGSLTWIVESRLGFNGNFYFYADDYSEYGGELWRSDGSQENTVLVKDINPGPGRSEIRGFAAANGRLFFVADDGVHGRELWVSDGTESGTNMVTDINPSGSSFSYYSTVYKTDLNGLVFFSANDGTHGNELWQSDGTAAGTAMVMDINPGLPNSSPSSFTVMENILYFSADDGFHGREIWALSHAVLAQDDYVVTRMGQPVIIVFLDNDNYLNPDQLAIAIASQPQHGQVTLNNTTFIYTPEMGYIGADSFTYTLADGINTPKMATVYISVDGRKSYLPLIINYIEQ